MNPAAALLALCIDAWVGDPPRVYRRVPHPVALIGWLVSAVERLLDPLPAGAGARTGRGAVLVALVVAVVVAAALLVQALFGAAPFGGVLEALLASTLVAFRSLHEHVAAVARALRCATLDAPRAAIAHIVGRDPATLDRAGIARAATESLAENWSDGVVAPLFWYVVAGLPGLFAYKAINTLDSMVGYRSARYASFGRAAAQLDDLMNWPAARLAGLLLAIAAFGQRGASGRAALRAMWRDARRHRSPNAGWPEAAMAGALGFRLAGPRVYAGQRVDDVWMGDGRAELGGADVWRALSLYRHAGGWLGIALAALALFA